MSKAEVEMFMYLRHKVACYLYKYTDYSFCKSYEGTWELLVSYPNYFNDTTATASPCRYQIILHCYALGPNRHYYNWVGSTWLEALEKCKISIEDWTKDCYLGGD